MNYVCVIFIIYIFLNDAPIYEYIFLSTRNSYESSYDPRVTSFHSLPDPLTMFEFNNIGNM